MKKKLLIMILAGGAGMLILRSNSAGPSAVSHHDCTGAESAGTGVYANPIGCAATTACHGSVGGNTPTILVSLELDSAGISTTHYKGGRTYTVKITGTNLSGISLPFYGFQVAALADSVSTASNADAGVWTTTGLPAQTQCTPPSSSGTQLTVMEHNSRITVPSPGTIFTETFTWTAPPAGTGTISFWGAANFVNGDALASALDYWNTGSLIIHQWPVPVSVPTVPERAGTMLFPNPVQSMLHIAFTGGYPDGGNIYVFDLNGRLCLTQTFAPGCQNNEVQVDMSALKSGLYEVQVVCGKDIRVYPVNKQ